MSSKYEKTFEKFTHLGPPKFSDVVGENSSKF